MAEDITTTTPATDTAAQDVTVADVAAAANGAEKPKRESQPKDWKVYESEDAARAAMPPKGARTFVTYILKDAKGDVLGFTNQTTSVDARSAGFLRMGGTATPVSRPAPVPQTPEALTALLRSLPADQLAAIMAGVQGAPAPLPVPPVPAQVVADAPAQDAAPATKRGKKS
jgi:hypothetical protein